MDGSAAEKLLAVARLKIDIPTLEAEEGSRVRSMRALAKFPTCRSTTCPTARPGDNIEHLIASGRGANTASHKQHFELGEAPRTDSRLPPGSPGHVSSFSGADWRDSSARWRNSCSISMHDGAWLYGLRRRLVRDDAMFGTAQLPKSSDDMFSTLREDWQAGGSSELAKQGVPPEEFGNASSPVLIPTAEVPLTNLVRERIIDEDVLPMRFTACTPCFRAEAGAAGKDTRGMIRQHQFTKVELRLHPPEQSRDEHERMLACAEEVLRRLDLHYRVVTLCTGDMGFAAQRPTTSRSGCRDRMRIARSRPARRAASSRHDA